MTQAVKHPLKWRLADVQGAGYEQVNIVLPDTDLPANQERLLATDIPSPIPTAMDVHWSEEDGQLFYLLLDKMLDLGANESWEIQSPEVVDILHVVAAAHFIAPLESDAYLAKDIVTILQEVDLGDLVAIHTVDGFKSAIITELDSIEATCVLLEAINMDDDEMSLDVYDTLVVNKHSLLPAEFGNVVPGDEATIH